MRGGISCQGGGICCQGGRHLLLGNHYLTVYKSTKRPASVDNLWIVSLTTVSSLLLAFGLGRIGGAL